MRPNASKPSRHRERGYTLIEMLIVISIMGIFAAILLPRFEPSVRDQLRGAAEIVSGDVAYARNLAVTNDSQYKLQFKKSNSSYSLTHSGTNNLLDVLPPTPYRNGSGSLTEQVTFLEDFPHLGAAVEIHGVTNGGGSVGATGSLEFTSLGGIAGGQSFTIWLACGSGDTRRYQALIVAPVTGLVALGEFRASAP